MSGSSGDTARTLILIGLVLQFLAVVVLFLVGLAAVSFLGAIGGVLLAFAFLGLVWGVLVYIYSYSPVNEGSYEDARTPTLVIGILSLLFGGVLPGILYLIAWVKIRDAIEEEETAPFPEHPVYPPTGGYTYPTVAAPAPSPPLASAGAPATPARFCSTCGAAAMPGAKFCRGCGAAIL